MTDPSARHRTWERERLEPALERSPERRHRFSTISDVEVERLYGPWLKSDRDDGGFPGDPPFTRGIHPTGYRSRLWTMRMFAGFGAAEDTNARFRQLLAAGQTGLSIAYDMPTLYGYDTDDPEAEGEFGTCGVAVSSLADMEVLLDGLPLDRVSTSMTINSPAAPIWAMYIAAAEKRGVPRAVLEGTTQNDILKEFIAQKEYLFPPDPSMRLVTDTIEFGTRELPRWNTISISGYHIREAGSTAVQELAFTIADGMAYVEAALRRGLRIDDFAPRLSFFFNSHSEFFEEIAKFRASRRVWYRLMRERYHAENERSTWMRFHTQTAGVSLTAQQPLNNLTRVAFQALAAVLGGTQSLHTDSYDEAWAVPSAEAALLALRQQQILAEETGVASTVDPLGGSWFVESLTDETERAVWRYLDEIDRRGGMVAAIREGYPQREIADAAYRFQRELDAGERTIVGVNRHADPDEQLAIPLLTVSAASERAQRARLERIRRERDATAVDAALTGLREAARRPGTSETNLMPHFLRCANAYATLGEQCGVLREVFGEYREPVAV
jgi:methylmalonyl-CoA mutase, N-terminal domain